MVSAAAPALSHLHCAAATGCACAMHCNQSKAPTKNPLLCVGDNATGEPLLCVGDNATGALHCGAAPCKMQINCGALHCLLARLAAHHLRRSPWTWLGPPRLPSTVSPLSCGASGYGSLRHLETQCWHTGNLALIPVAWHWLYRWVASPPFDQKAFWGTSAGQRRTQCRQIFICVVIWRPWHLL